MIKKIYRGIISSLLLVFSTSVTISCIANDEQDFKYPNVKSINGYSNTKGLTPQIDNRSLYKQLDPQDSVGSG